MRLRHVHSTEPRLEPRKDGYSLKSSKVVVSCFSVAYSPVLDRYVYDLKVPHDVDPTPFQPKPLDGEVESFDVSLHISRLTR